MIVDGKRKSGSIYFPNRMMVTMESIMAYPLSIVEAPMGYGKTTAVREVLKLSRGNVQWQNVYDPSINVFWTGFCKMISGFDSEMSDCLLCIMKSTDI